MEKQYKYIVPQGIEDVEAFINRDDIIKQYKDIFMIEFQLSQNEYTDEDCIADFCRLYDGVKV